MARVVENEPVTNECQHLRVIYARLFLSTSSLSEERDGELE